MQEVPQHLGALSQCGICSDSIQTAELAVALYRSNSNPALYRCSRPFIFPSRDPVPLRFSRPFVMCNRRQLATFRVAHNAIENAFCDADDCRDCAASPEAAAVHYDCYEILMHECLVDDRQALHRRLLFLASWRKPWREAKPLFLPNRVDKHTLGAVAEMFGLPQLCGLPRSISALRVATYVSDMRDESQQSEVVALRHVISWERGGKLDKSDSRTLAPIIRLTIDSDGISRVERLSSHPRYLRGNYTHTAYIVGSDNDEELSKGVEVEIVDGHLRLKLPPYGPVPHIWNTPTPPLLSLCNISPYRLPATWSRLFAVEPDSIRGITFFYNHEYLCDIHIHYPEGPSAQSTYDQIKHTVQRNIMWLYLPIPRGDRLTVIGARRQLNTVCHLFRLEKSGDVIIGACLSSSFGDNCLGRGAPLTLIYGEPDRADEDSEVDLFGAYCGAESQFSKELQLPDNFPLDKYEPNYFSWAPLDGVASALVFRDQTTGCCRGILFHYLDGGSRAIGECRLHVDPAQRVAGPSRFCVQTESHPANWHPSVVLYRTRVTFQNGLQHEHVHDHEQKHEQPVGDGWSVDKEWKCYPMTGCVKFWFAVELSFISVTTESHTETAAQN
ncbi:hypothetical protein GGI42DRAFT_361720 [Trichoderma sp. SZMC 28013]